jgi:hypothetical protein
MAIVIVVQINLKPLDVVVKIIVLVVYGLMAQNKLKLQIIFMHQILRNLYQWNLNQRLLIVQLPHMVHLDVLFTKLY